MSSQRVIPPHPADPDGTHDSRYWRRSEAPTPGPHDHDDEYAPLSHISDLNNPHAVTKTQVGLSSVDNTSDANKPVSTATQTAINLKANVSDLNNHAGASGNVHGITVPSAIVGTNETQTLTNKTLSSPTITNFTAATHAHTSAATGGTLNIATATTGTLGVSRGGSGRTANMAYALVVGGTTTTAAQESITNGTTDQILAANGTSAWPSFKTGTKAMVGLGQVDNTSDASKPVSTATQTALNGKSNVGHTHNPAVKNSGWATLSSTYSGADVDVGSVSVTLVAGVTYDVDVDLWFTGEQSGGAATCRVGVLFNGVVLGSGPVIPWGTVAVQHHMVGVASVVGTGAAMIAAIRLSSMTGTVQGRNWGGIVRADARS